MRAFVTGATGFLGGRLTEQLRARGDDVVALDRRTTPLSDRDGLRKAMDGCDAVFHLAAVYKVGISRSERAGMYEANVRGTENVLDAARDVPRVVHVSTVNVFGNTRGRIVDETYRRDLAQGFLSWYDETKYGAHEVAEQRIRGGAPITVALPSQVYGPGDHSEAGDQLRRARAGRLAYRALDDVGFGLVHVDDLAVGIVAVLDAAQVGRQYVLSGPTTTLREAIALAAAIGGRRPPAVRVPTALLSAMAPLGGLIGRPNLTEVISAAAGVTYWASAARAQEELGWQARDLEAGFSDAFGAA